MVQCHSKQNTALESKIIHAHRPYVQPPGSQLLLKLVMIFHVVLHQIFVRKKERWLVSELILGPCSGENNLFA